MSEQEVKLLTREEAIAVNQDPTGKRWVIKSQRGKALLVAQVEPYNGNTHIPKVFGGQWTSRTKLQAAIEDWLSLQWDKVPVAKPLSTPKPVVKKEADILKAVAEENAALEAARKRVTDAGDQIK